MPSPGVRLLLNTGPMISPRQLPGVTERWDLADGTGYTDVDATTPATASDLLARVNGSLGSYNLLQATEGTRPTFSNINGYPAMSFDAAPRWVAADPLAALVTGSSPIFTFGAVVQVTSFAAARNIFSFGRAASGSPFHLGQTNTSGFAQQSRRNDSNTNQAYNPAFRLTAGVPFLVVFRTNGSVGDTWINGQPAGSGTMATNPATLDQFTIGAQRLNAVTIPFLGLQAIPFFCGGVVLPDAAIRGLHRWTRSNIGVG
jgi:hypothetical protein